jgi:hypothetical protein
MNYIDIDTLHVFRVGSKCVLIFRLVRGVLWLMRGRVGGQEQVQVIRIW